MPSTYTLNNGIELIGTGEQSGTWGDTTNINLELLDTALDGQVSVALGAPGSSGSPNNLPISDGAASNGRNRMITFTDGTDLGATAFVQLTPNDSEKIIYVRNSLSGSRSIILFQGTYNASNDYEVPAGTTAVVYFDGAGTGAVAANVFNNAHFDALNVVGSVTVGGGVTVTGTVDAGTVEFDNLSGTGAVSVTNILDEDNMASNSATALSTQQSIKAYVDAQVGSFDTLAEVLAQGNTTGGTDLAVSTGDDITFADGSKAIFGAGNDLQIYHDGNNSLIDEVGTGSLFIRGTTVNIQHIDSDPDESMINAVANGAVTLSHNGFAKIATTATGVDITGTVTATGTSVFASLDISGDIDVDGTTNLDVVDIDGAVNMATTALVTGVLTTTAAAVFNGGFATAADITFGDNDKAIFGAGNDLQIYHQSTGTAGSYIAENGAGDLRISGNNLWLNDSSGDTYFRAVNGSYAKIYHAGNEKLATSSTGVDVTGNISATGTVTATGGLTTAGAIAVNRAAGYGSVEVGGPSGAFLDLKSPASDDYDARIIYNGGSELQITTLSASEPIWLSQGGSTKLKTSSTGVDVYGNLTATGNVSGANGTFTGDVTIGDDLTLSGANPVINIVETGVNQHRILGTGGSLYIQAQDSDGTTDGDMHLTGYLNADLGLLNIKSANTTISGDVTAVNGTFTGDVTIGDDLFLTGPSPTITLTDTDTAAEYTKLYNSSGHTYIDSRNGASNGLIIFRGKGGGATTEYARFNETGNLGIGNSTPQAMLHVGGSDTSLGTTAGNDISLLTLQADVSNNDLLQFTSERTSTGTTWTTAAHRIQRKVDASLMGYMQFGNNTSDLVTFGENSSEYMRIDGSGKVGIGTTNPTEKLDVAGNAKISGGSSGKAGLVVSGASAVGWGLEIGTHVAGTASDLVFSANAVVGHEDSVSYTMEAGGYYRWMTGATSRTGGIAGASEAMRIDGGGNTVFGDSNPTFYNDTTGREGVSFNQSGVIQTSKDGGASQLLNRQGTNGSIVNFYKTAVGVGSISVTGSATAYNTSSDYRLKENITPIKGAADVVMAMQPCTYTAIADGLWYDGFLAHELAEVHPRAVQGTKDAMMDEEYEVTPAVYEDVVTPAVDAVAATYDDEGLELTPAVEAAPETTESVLVTEAVMGTRSVPDMQSVDYSKITPILTAALQEALTEIAALKVRVAALESA